MLKIMLQLVVGTCPVVAAIRLATINTVNLNQGKMFLTDFIKGRKNISCQESEGINLAVYLINEFKDRRFTFRGLKNKYSGVDAEELLKLLQKEIDSTLILYRYITSVKKFTDRKGVPQVKIRIIGKASSMNRYNPLDIELDITTEM
ncbi:MAG: hypothetical protein A2167_04175 [Planctomycetes bacterium RBG_13_46_10]|nr:MAG: hypothetical protein A2167_04175 [Planctomycetes bacterium RBG_13_46_10]